MLRRDQLPTRRGLVAVVLCAALVAALTHASGFWSTICVGYLALTMTIAVLTWRRADSVQIAFYVGAAILSMVEADRFASALSFHLAPVAVRIAQIDWEWYRDVMTLIVLFAPFYLTVVAVLAMRGVAMRRHYRTTDIF